MFSRQIAAFMPCGMTLNSYSFIFTPGCTLLAPLLPEELLKKIECVATMSYSTNTLENEITSTRGEKAV